MRSVHHEVVKGELILVIFHGDESINWLIGGKGWGIWRNSGVFCVNSAFSIWHLGDGACGIVRGKICHVFFADRPTGFRINFLSAEPKRKLFGKTLKDSAKRKLSGKTLRGSAKRKWYGMTRLRCFRLRLYGASARQVGAATRGSGGRRLRGTRRRTRLLSFSFIFKTMGSPPPRG